jgi:D-sedoheptulose 7-phosphate isomerase
MAVMSATEYLQRLGACLTTVDATGSLDESMQRCVEALQIVRRHCRTVHLIGNGGSASVVAHAQNDLVKACGIPAMIHQDVPLMTAYGNDHGYGQAYADALDVWIDASDVLIAVSSSGASTNIINAVLKVKSAGAMVVTCSGFKSDNPLRQLGDLNFYVPSSDYGQVELTHAALLHCLTDRLAHA